MTPLQKYAEMKKQAGLPRYLANIAKNPHEAKALMFGADVLKQDLRGMVRKLPGSDWLALRARSKDADYMAANVKAHLSGRSPAIRPPHNASGIQDVRRRPHEGDGRFSGRPLRNISSAPVPNRPMPSEPYRGYHESRGHELYSKLRNVPRRNDVNYPRTYGVAVPQKPFYAQRAPYLDVPYEMRANR